ncbi:hypothetical protein CVT24_008644 [Panaeolus cyanescens]|uniref:Calcineurin-like phosphoesterase domain-containing protein n=1 Tax=Panaeolus cyanescens TaxID=181874 RepID=A0A409VB99_9AGAR|nr:hypothetical protein CVT24_008644 [Panaeolus cyanescens]
MRLLPLFLLVAQPSASINPSTFTAPGAFPTTAFSKYYNEPTATSAQVQPVISDPVTHEIYPLGLTDPNNIPTVDKVDPHPLPPTAPPSRILQESIQQLHSIAANPFFVNSTCASCQAALSIGKIVALASPSNGPQFLTEFCNTLTTSTTCNITYDVSGIGSVLTQVIANADISGYDGQAICQNFFSLCPAPPTASLDLSNWFAKPKPSPLPPLKQRSGKRLTVLHISDVHLDPRYATGSEANCTSGTCCRSNKSNPSSPSSVLAHAPRFGAYQCDSPLSLVMSGLQAIPPLTGTLDTGFAWSIYTGDLVSHDPDNQLSREYVEYTETVLYDLFKRTLGSGPVYATMGNHDSYNQAQDAPQTLGGQLAKQFSWNYDHLSSLWQHEDWLPASAVELARAHYGGYMVKRGDGLRIISLNTNLWYRANYFNYINMTNPDTSGMLRFLTDELQDAEDAGDRVWIIGHVISGWDGTNPLKNPTNLYIFFGHTHEDQLNIFYANNGTVMSAETAQAVSWIGPSFTPNTNLNSGFRVYEVDSATFEIMDAHTWRSDVNAFPELDPQLQFGPTYAYEYNTRQTYGESINWGPNEPLNATWWHHVTEAMEANSTLVSTFNTLQGKSSLPPELWLEIISWATHNPIIQRLEDVQIQPFQPLSYPRHGRDANLETSVSISMVCKTWKQWVARTLYQDIRVRSNLLTLKHVLQRETDGDASKICGDMVHRVVLPYPSTVTRPFTRLESVDILKLCQNVRTLLRPPDTTPSMMVARFDCEAEEVALPSLQRLEWWHHPEAERSGGINSLPCVLRNAPNLRFLFIAGFIGPTYVASSPERIELPKLETLRLHMMNGMILHQIITRWSLPSLTHLILDSPVVRDGLDIVWTALSDQLLVVEFGKHVRFYMTDNVTPCIQSCRKLQMLNYYVLFTAPPASELEHSTLTTVSLNMHVNSLIGDSVSVWSLIEHHFDILCGKNLTALQNVVLYGDWKAVWSHPRFAPIKVKLEEAGRKLETVDGKY